MAGHTRAYTPMKFVSPMTSIAPLATVAEVPQRKREHTANAIPRSSVLLPSPLPGL